MVKLQLAGAFRGARRSRDHHQRRLLGQSAGGGVHHVERTRAVGHGGDAERAVRPARHVRGESDRGLVAQRVERQDPALLHHPEEPEHEVAWNAEDLGRPAIPERLEQRLAQIHRPIPSSAVEPRVRCADPPLE